MRRGGTATAVEPGGGAPAGNPAARVRTRRSRTVIALVCALAQTPAHAVAAPAASLAPADPPAQAAYRLDPAARPVRGSVSPGVAGPRLTPGTYTDTISAGERKHYRVALDGASNAYVSAVLVPPPGSRVSPAEGIGVSLTSADGAQCSVSNEITFGGATPLPVADYSTRRMGQGRQCQSAGDYRYTVRWLGPEGASDAEGWTVELKYMSEPGLRSGTAGPTAGTGPTAWHSHAPDHVSGPAKDVAGGTGFNDAPAVGHGAWRDSVNPGESRFYQVPLDWGQQLFVDAEFGGPSAQRAPAAAGGLRMTFFNTARGHVADTAEDYRGGPADLSLATAPAAFANRLRKEDDISAMRFSGWYYVRVSLDHRIDRALPVTLRVGVEGEPQPAPGYERDPHAAGFGVTDDDREAAHEGRRVAADDDDAREALLTAVGFTGIGLGSALLLGLLGWTGLTRFGPGRTRGRHAVTSSPRDPARR